MVGYDSASQDIGFGCFSSREAEEVGQVRESCDDLACGGERKSVDQREGHAEPGVFKEMSDSLHSHAFLPEEGCQFTHGVDSDHFFGVEVGSEFLLDVVNQVKHGKRIEAE